MSIMPFQGISETIDERIEHNTREIEVEINAITPYAAFAAIDSYLRGIIHIKDLKKLFEIHSALEVLKAGDKIQVILGNPFFMGRVFSKNCVHLELTYQTVNMLKNREHALYR